MEVAHLTHTVSGLYEASGATLQAYSLVSMNCPHRALEAPIWRLCGASPVRAALLNSNDIQVLSIVGLSGEQKLIQAHWEFLQ